MEIDTICIRLKWKVFSLGTYLSKLCCTIVLMLMSLPPVTENNISGLILSSLKNVQNKFPKNFRIVTSKPQRDIGAKVSVASVFTHRHKCIDLYFWKLFLFPPFGSTWWLIIQHKMNCNGRWYRVVKVQCSGFQGIQTNSGCAVSKPLWLEYPSELQSLHLWNKKVRPKHLRVLIRTFYGSSIRT